MHPISWSIRFSMTKRPVESYNSAAFTKEMVRLKSNFLGTSVFVDFAYSKKSIIFIRTY